MTERLSTHPAGSDQPCLYLPAAGLPTCVGASAAVHALLSTPRQPGGKNPAPVPAPVPKSQCFCSDQPRGCDMPLSLHIMPSVPVIYILVPSGVQSFPSRETSPCLESAPCLLSQLSSDLGHSLSIHPFLDSTFWSLVRMPSDSLPCQAVPPLLFAVPTPLSCLILSSSTAPDAPDPSHPFCRLLDKFVSRFELPVYSGKMCLLTPQGRICS